MSMISFRLHDWTRDLRTPALREHLRAMEQEAADRAVELEWQRRVAENVRRRTNRSRA